MPKTVDLFVEDIDTLIGCCLAPSLCQDKLECLCGAAEPFQMTCEQLDLIFASSVISVVIFLVLSLVPLNLISISWRTLSIVPSSCSFRHLGRVDRFSTMSTVHVRILFVSWQFKKPFQNICKEISQTMEGSSLLRQSRFWWTRTRLLQKSSMSWCKWLRWLTPVLRTQSNSVLWLWNLTCGSRSTWHSTRKDNFCQLSSFMTLRRLSTSNGTAWLLPDANLLDLDQVNRHQVTS